MDTARAMDSQAIAAENALWLAIDVLAKCFLHGQWYRFTADWPLRVILCNQNSRSCGMSEPVAKRIKDVDEKFCGDCGEIIKAKAEICPKCGVRQIAPPGPFGASAPNGKNRVIAALLAFFIGGFGIHKFYLGQIGQGIVYLLFFWTVIPFVVAFVESILYLLMSDQEFNRKYGNR